MKAELANNLETQPSENTPSKQNKNKKSFIQNN